MRAYRSVPLTAELFDGRRYVRMRQLRHLLDTAELEDGLRWAAEAGSAGGTSATTTTTLGPSAASVP